ncbi:MAG: hypothetical protein LDLANPLL_02812 [Turneriella sp.]|nr:hypothetical protein [Turneriella sp.]
MEAFFWDSTGQVNLWLQSIMPSAKFFLPITFTGEKLFFFILIPFVFFTLERRAALSLLWLLLISYAVNSFVKIAFMQPRPFWINKVPAYVFEGSFGLPSGHSQNAVVVWGYLAYFLITVRHLPKLWTLGFTVIWVFLIALSRLVLGVHFLQDILSGLLIGFVLLYLFIKAEHSAHEVFLKQKSIVQTFVILVFCGIILSGAILLTQNQTLPELNYWSAKAQQSIKMVKEQPVRHLEPFSIDAFLTIIGCVLGLYFATALPQKNYTMPKKLGWRLLHFILAEVFVLTIFLSLSWIFPKEGFWGDLLRVVRYFLVIIATFYVYPYFSRHLPQ